MAKTITKEIVSDKDNYIVDFEFSEYVAIIRIYRCLLGEKSDILSTRTFKFDKKTTTSEVIYIVKESIKEIEEPNKLFNELSNWNGHLRNSMTQEEKNDVIEDILNIMLDAIADAGGLTSKSYEHLSSLIDKLDN
jgi:ribose 5-phosphate isomerase